MHLHKSDQRGAVFNAKDVADTGTCKFGVISNEQILKILPAPVMDNSERYHFAEVIPEVF